MKLLFCAKCYDIVKLYDDANDIRECKCGSSSACYTDVRNATVHGDGVLLGILNNEFVSAYRSYSKNPDDENLTNSVRQFTSFFITESSPYIKRE